MVSEAKLEQLRYATKMRMEKAAERQDPPAPWVARRQRVRLFQDELGEWFIYCRGGSPVRATDWEVSLWMEVCELKRKLSVISDQ